MAEKIKFSEAKRGLKRQELIREGKQEIRGRESKEIIDLIGYAHKVLDDLRKTEEGRKNEEAIMKFAEELEIPKQDLEKAFENGLRFNVKAAYKIGFLDEVGGFYEYERMKSVISSFVLNFRSTLSFFRRRKEKFLKPKKSKSEGGELTNKFIILSIAERGYIVPPFILDEFDKKYPGASRDIFFRAIYSHPREFNKMIEVLINENNKKGESDKKGEEKS